jgi:hypothetical protein
MRTDIRLPYQAMTGYEARWHNLDIGRGHITTLARTLPSISFPNYVVRDHAIDTAAPDDFSDLVALAGPAALDDGYHDYPAALHTNVANHRGRPDGPSVLLVDHDHADPLLKLAAEYEHALLHEAFGERRKLNTNEVERPPAQQPPRDPFDEANLAPSSQSLVDLLVTGQNIDTIIDSLDPFGADRIFENDRRHEILALLAPPTHVATHTSLAAPLARAEHHLISVDSPIDVLATQSNEPGPEHE